MKSPKACHDIQAVRGFVGYRLPPWAAAIHFLVLVLTGGLSVLACYAWPQIRLWGQQQCSLSQADYVRAEVVVPQHGTAASQCKRDMHSRKLMFAQRHGQLMSLLISLQQSSQTHESLVAYKHKQHAWKLLVLQGWWLLLHLCIAQYSVVTTGMLVCS